MGKNKGLLAAVIGGVALFGAALYYYVLTQLDLIKKFTYQIVSINITRADPMIIKGQIVFLFENISNIDITVSEFYLDFYFNQKRVGYLEDVKPFQILAKQSTQIPFSFSLEPQLVLGNLTDIYDYYRQNKDGKIVVSGYVSAKSGFVKATIPVTYTTTVKELLES